eukprot:6150240-Heterocapsa_arctica.AAC.1
MNVKTKEVTALWREGKTFILDVWVKIPGAVKSKTPEADPTPQKSSGFQHAGVVTTTPIRPTSRDGK